MEQVNNRPSIANIHSAMFPLGLELAAHIASADVIGATNRPTGTQRIKLPGQWTTDSVYCGRDSPSVELETRREDITQKATVKSRFEFSHSNRPKSSVPYICLRGGNWLPFGVWCTARDYQRLLGGEMYKGAMALITEKMSSYAPGARLQLEGGRPGGGQNVDEASDGGDEVEVDIKVKRE